MIGRLKDWLLAFAGGVLLALMIDCNSLLAKHTTAVFASWTAHGVGAAVALILVLLSSRAYRRDTGKEAGRKQAKPLLWLYFGGIPGAFTVMLAAIAVNGSLSLSGTIALMLAGQMIFGMMSDHFGLLLAARRRIVKGDLLAMLCILGGSAMIIFGKG